MGDEPLEIHTDFQQFFGGTGMGHPFYEKFLHRVPLQPRRRATKTLVKFRDYGSGRTAGKAENERPD